MRYPRIVAPFFAAALAGCGPFVPVTDMATVSRDDRAAASEVRLYRVGESPTSGFHYVGQVKAYSCKLMIWDPPSSTGNALEQLRFKAASMGADAIMDVTTTDSGTDAFGTNCWNAVEAEGTAIKLKHAP